MFSIKDSIKFMMAKIFFTLADFSYTKIKEITPPMFHGSDTVEIKYIKSGKGKINISNEIHNITKSSYIVIPELTSYSIIPTEEIEVYSIYLLIDKKTGYKEYTPMLTRKFIGVDKYDLGLAFDSLLYEFQNKGFGYNEIIVSNFKSIIVKILRNENAKGQRLSHWESTNLQFEIEKMLYNEFNTITIIEIASRLHISPRELQRYLIKNYNKSFRELKNDAKMSFAANKLKYTDIKISDLSLLVGYSTPEHFSYAFKKYFNESPQNYKKRNCK